MTTALKIALYDRQDFYFEEVQTENGTEFHIGTQTWKDMTTQWDMPRIEHDRPADERLAPVGAAEGYALWADGIPR